MTYRVFCSPPRSCRAGVEGVEILDLTLTWMPDGATEPLVLDLVSFFADVHDEGHE